MQIGAADAPERVVNKPLLGHFAKAGVAPKRVLTEFKVTSDAILPVGTLAPRWCDRQAPRVSQACKPVLAACVTFRTKTVCLLNLALLLVVLMLFLLSLLVCQERPSRRRTLCQDSTSLCRRQGGCAGDTAVRSWRRVRLRACCVLRRPALRANSQGKGFQGGMKRWGFGGLAASHGVSVSHRSIGATGGRQVCRLALP